ncbi:MAG: hypothetical protein EOO92_22295 [Pedobacter sp.]|nr:MAG: hypothetical protein EOO92_22295 [Pedobacter sp.]
MKIRQNGFGNVLALTDSLGKYKLSIADDDILSTYTFDLIGYSRSESTLNNNMVVKLSEYLMLLGSISTINLAINKEPLYYVYTGKKGCTIDGSEFKAIPQEWIKQIEVLNDAKSTALFGSKGINGVIMVEIKSDHAKKINFSKKK